MKILAAHVGKCALVNAPCPGEHFAAFPFASDNLLRFRRVSPILFRLFALASIISPRTLTIGRDASAYTRYLGIASKGLARMHKFVRTALPAFDEHGFRLPDATRSAESGLHQFNMCHRINILDHIVSRP